MMLFIKLKKRSEADKVDEKTKKDWSQDTAQHWLGRSGLEVALETLLYTITISHHHHNIVNIIITILIIIAIITIIIIFIVNHIGRGGDG